MDIGNYTKATKHYKEAIENYKEAIENYKKAIEYYLPSELLEAGKLMKKVKELRTKQQNLSNVIRESQ